MQYFVSTENTPYFHWQLELLIESFKQQDYESNLVVAVAEKDSPQYSHFLGNLFDFQITKIGHENIGEIKGHNKLNSLYSLLWAVKNQLLQQPFAMISPHVVMRTPIEVTENYPQIIISSNPYFTIENAEENIGPFWEWLGTNKEDYEKHWNIPGSIMMFNEIPVEIFQNTIALAELLCVHQILNNKKIHNYTIELAWAITFAHIIPTLQVSFERDYTLTGNMLENNNAPFIDYDHGAPPLFSKSLFLYPPPKHISAGDPFKILSENAISQNSNFIAQLAKLNLEKRESYDRNFKELLALQD